MSTTSSRRLTEHQVFYCLFLILPLTCQSRLRARLLRSIVFPNDASTLLHYLSPYSTRYISWISFYTFTHFYISCRTTCYQTCT
ncbi:hypothetical protein K438DRAFT_1801503 [Mycena galopus ATCC 62051]|nr:hypothetical protein K438DRAFT_1801503 [Mycena galopus ATCC 62051]